MKLLGKVALITGAGGGIGRAIALRLAAEGASLALLDIGESLAATAQAVRAASGRCECEHADIADAGEVGVAVAALRARLGSIDCLVNNAGITNHIAPLTRMDPARWERELAVNLSGTMHCIQQVLPAMLQAGYGRIVNVASTAGLTGYAYVSAYVAAKHGVVGLTRALALELAQKGITVNAVCPGYTETEIVKTSIERVVAKTGRTPEQALAEFVKGNPQGRLVQPQEVADAVLWLCGAGAAAITGQAIAVAGGEVM